MKVRNNYNECLTNLACSIRKYFGLNYQHNTLPYIDKILESKKPDNVVIVLFDGMGSKILNRTLDENSFFKKNMYKEITTVFPATTTAATTSIRTGLNPIEHGWLGWNTYIKDIDKTITLYFDSEKGKNEICNEFLNVKNKLISKTISDEINEAGIYEGLELFPFKAGNAKVYKNLDDMLNTIIDKTKETGKKFIYAYDTEPDHTMHEYGAYSEKTKKLIIERNRKVEELSEKIEDTLLIVVADHGHIKVNHIYLEEYKNLYDMLERTTSIEQRATSFKVKEEYKTIFPEEFNKLFGDKFILCTKEEVKENGLFGDGLENELFDSALGDFLAVAIKEYCIVTTGDEVLYSQHAGYTDDEIFIPLIVIDRTSYEKN